MMSWEGATVMLFLVTTLVAIHSGNFSRAPALPTCFTCGFFCELFVSGTQDTLSNFVNACSSLSSEFLVSSIETVVADYGLPESFIGVILLPIVGQFSVEGNTLGIEYAIALVLAVTNTLTFRKARPLRK